MTTRIFVLPAWMLLFALIGSVTVDAYGQVVDADRSSPGVASGYSTSGDGVIKIALYKKTGDEFNLAATVEMKNSIYFNSEGIVTGVENLQRLQLVEVKDKWIPIIKRELVDGRAIVTTEDGNTYTIFNLGIGPFAGQIEFGSATAVPQSESPMVQPQSSAESSAQGPDAARTTALVDKRAVLNKSTEVADGYVELNKWVAELHRPIDALSAQIEKAKADYEKMKPRLSAAESAAEEYKVESLYSEHQQALKAAQAKVDARESAFVNGVIAEIDAIAEEIRASKGYADVKDWTAPAEGGLPVNSTNITQDVLDALNRKCGESATTLPESDAGQSAGPQASQRVHARHILVAVLETDKPKARKAKFLKAEDIRRQLLNGADFAETARKFSDCPSKVQGGDLGFFTKGVMVKPFEDAAFTQNMGEIGPVVETPFGYHIIQVLDGADQGGSHRETTRNFKLPTHMQPKKHRLRSIRAPWEKSRENE